MERSAVGPPAPLVGLEGLLRDLAHLLLSETPPERVLTSIADRLRDLVPHDRLAIYRANPSGRLLLPELVRGPQAQRILSSGPIPFGRGIPGAVAETGRPELIEDVVSDPRRHHLVAVADRPESVIAAPMMARAELKGVMCLSRLGKGGEFSSRELGVAVQFGTLAALFIDNTEIRARLERDVVTDHLTGLYNHRYFQERLAEEVARATRRQSSMGLLLFDIDDFRSVNDAQGHLFGDQLLQAIAEVSLRTCRAEDPVCRIGGEEFAVILPGQSIPDTVALGERLRSAIADTAIASTVYVTISSGVAGAPVHSVSTRDLFDRATLALLRAKATGKDRVCVYDARANASSPKAGGERIPERREAAAVDTSRTLNREMRSVAQVEVLHHLSRKLVRARGAVSIGREVREALRDAIGYHGCRLYLVDAAGQTLVPVLHEAHDNPEAGVLGDPIPVGTGVAGRAMASDRKINVGAHEGCELEIQGGLGRTESSLAVPLRYGDRVNGVIALCKPGTDQFDGDDERLVEIVAALSGIALENARLFLDSTPTARSESN